MSKRNISSHSKSGVLSVVVVIIIVNVVVNVAVVWNLFVHTFSLRSVAMLFAIVIKFAFAHFEMSFVKNPMRELRRERFSRKS
jgi:hypothetical protein